MKSKSPATNCFLQLLAHREKGRLRLVAWAIIKNAGRRGADMAPAALPAWTALKPTRCIKVN